MLPLFILLYIWPNYQAFATPKRSKDNVLIRNKLTEPEIYERYSSIYEMLDLKYPKPGAVFTCILFFARRIIFVGGVIFLIDYPAA